MGQALWSLQGEQGRRLCLRLQDAIRWWKVNWFRSDLRLARGSQEVRATLPTGPIRSQPRLRRPAGSSASSARIVRRSCGVLRRSRAQRRRRETKRLHDTHIWCCEVGEERDGRLSCSILARFIIADDTAYGQGNGVRLRSSIRMVAKMESH